MILPPRAFPVPALLNAEYQPVERLTVQIDGSRTIQMPGCCRS